MGLSYHESKVKWSLRMVYISHLDGEQRKWNSFCERGSWFTVDFGSTVHSLELWHRLWGQPYPCELFIWISLNWAVLFYFDLFIYLTSDYFMKGCTVVSGQADTPWPQQWQTSIQNNTQKRQSVKTWIGTSDASAVRQQSKPLCNMLVIIQTFEVFPQPFEPIGLIC